MQNETDWKPLGLIVIGILAIAAFAAAVIHLVGDGTIGQWIIVIGAISIVAFLAKLNK